ncbi:hypothetical protein M3172_25505, partial [Mesobacillus subterraneus]|uniref:hypothetical protein n=1 Tax=Mesobacillus subterraneus TaxID=285983 RepID=UPI00203B46BA
MPAALIVQTGSGEGAVAFGEGIVSFSACNVTGTMVSFCGGMEKHLLQLDTFIVPEVPLILYALFEYGLT